MTVDLLVALKVARWVSLTAESMVATKETLMVGSLAATLDLL